MGTKKAILDSANKLFSENGFDGTSVNDIAKHAKVNKPLIYYHFGSKDELLDYVLKDIISSAEEVTINILKEEKSKLIEKGKVKVNKDKFEVLNMTEEEVIESMNYTLTRIVDFYLDRRDIIKVLVVESLKKNERSDIMFKILNVLNSDKVTDEMKKQDAEFIFDTEALAERFFIGFMPIITFAIYYDEWTNYYKMSREDLKKIFLDRYLKNVGSAFLK